MVTYYVSLNESYFFDSLLLPDEMDEDVADEPNSKGELNVTRECGVRGEGLVNAFSAHK